MNLNQRSSYFAVKFAVDRMITAGLMVVALPIMLVVSLAILVLEGRPVFYRQTRVGKNGHPFRIWKFRTMCHYAEQATGAVWSHSSDPRVTPIGRWLRVSHLDELPQFLNVLVGDMNLIGPRPERPEFVRELAVELPYYLDRLNVRPGITGLAQLNLEYDQSIDDVQSKVLLDLEYIRTTNFRRDAMILLATIPYIARKLFKKLIADPAGTSDGKNGLAIGPSEIEVSTRVDQPDTESSVEPHAPRFPSIATGSNPNPYGAQPSGVLFTMGNPSIGHGNVEA